MLSISFYLMSCTAGILFLWGLFQLGRVTYNFVFEPEEPTTYFDTLMWVCYKIGYPVPERMSNFEALDFAFGSILLAPLVMLAGAFFWPLTVLFGLTLLARKIVRWRKERRAV